MSAVAIKCAPLESMLQALGTSLSDMQEDENQTSFRIEFENQFAIELQPLTNDLCRMSARLCALGKSQEVQNSQILKAFKLFEEVIDPNLSRLTLSISQYDNCLRLMCEFRNNTKVSEAQNTEELLNYLEFFASDAYAFKKTYFSIEASQSN